MSDKIFSKAIAHACKHCEHAAFSAFGDEILCRYRGVTRPDDCCRKYRYDPIKRVPKKLKFNKNYSSEDFTI